MAVAEKKIAQGQLGTSDAAAFTGTSGHTYTITTVVFCNTDTSDRTFRWHNVDAAGSSTAANAEFYDQPIPANSTLRIKDRTVVEGAGMLRGLASVASKVTYSVYGLDRSP